MISRTSEEFAELVREGLTLPGFHLCLSPLWGSKQAASRPAIRNALKMALASFSAPGKTSDWADSPESLKVLALSTPPRVSFASISISHCPTLGGFAFSPGRVGIGFDLEELSRLSISAIERVSTSEEIASAPDRTLLWSAKESAYKALAISGSALSGIITHSWRDLGNGKGYLFSAEVKVSSLEPVKKIRGLVACRENYTLAISTHSD